MLVSGKAFVSVARASARAASLIRPLTSMNPLLMQPLLTRGLLTPFAVLQTDLKFGVESYEENDVVITRRVTDFRHASY